MDEVFVLLEVLFLNTIIINYSFIVFIKKEKDKSAKPIEREEKYVHSLEKQQGK